MKGDHTVLSCYVSPGKSEKLTLVDLSLTEIEGERARQNHPDSPALPHRRGSMRATRQAGRRCTARQPSTPRPPRDSSSTTARTWTPFPPRAARRFTSQPCTAPQASPRYALRRSPVPQGACAQRGLRNRALSGFTVVLPRALSARGLARTDPAPPSRCKALLSAGADVLARDADGLRPADLAAAHALPELLAAHRAATAAERSRRRAAGPADEGNVKEIAARLLRHLRVCPGPCASVAQGCAIHGWRG